MFEAGRTVHWQSVEENYLNKGIRELIPIFQKQMHNIL